MYVPTVHLTTARTCWKAFVLVAFLAAACSSATDEAANATTTSTTTEASSTTATESPTTTAEETTTTETPSPDTEFPAVVWGIEADTYDVVEVDTASGEVLRRIPGWGDEFVDPDVGPLQALQTIDVVGEIVWTGDCCEPAVGSVFGVETSSDVRIPDSSIRSFGIDPVISPDGASVAVGALDIGVTVFDAATGATTVDPQLIDELLPAPTGVEPPLFPRALTWLDPTTVVVAQTTETVSNVVVVDLSDPADPAVVGPVIEVFGRIIDGAVDGDGDLVMAVHDPTAEVTFGQVFALATGAELSTFLLDPDASAIDYDESGRFLLVARPGRAPAWQGAGTGGVLPGPALVDAVWDAGGAPIPTSEPITVGDAGIEPFEFDAVNEAGLEGIGCWLQAGFERTSGPLVYHQGFDRAFMVIDGSPQLFDVPSGYEVGDPLANDGFELVFENVGAPIRASIESTEWELTLVVAPTAGGDPTRIDGRLWCGV